MRAIHRHLGFDDGHHARLHAPGDEITEGLDGLAKRLAGYRQQGARFAKWRAVYNVSDKLPGWRAIQANAEALACYAAICGRRTWHRPSNRRGTEQIFIAALQTPADPGGEKVADTP